MSAKRLKRSVVKCVEREGLAVVLLGPVGQSGLHLEKRVDVHGVRVPPEMSAAAFDFLRQRLVGKEVEFDDYALEGRTGADIYVEGAAVGVEMVAKGLGLPFKGPKPTKLYEQLLTASESAAAAGLGLHAPKPKPVKRPAPPTPQQAVGSTLHCWIDEFNYDLTFKVYAEELGAKFDACFRSIAIPVIGRDHANSFRNWTAKNALQRGFEARLAAVEEGRLQLVATRPGDPDCVVGRLLALGWARLENDAASKLEAMEFVALRALQEQAMADRLRLWQNFQGKLPKDRAAVDARWAGEFEARVVEVNSGDSVTLQKVDEEARVRVFLSHVRAPAMGSRGEEPRPWAWEAREHLRRALIGQKVRARIDVVRKVEKEGKEPLEIFQATLLLENGHSAAEELLAAGLASFQPPRNDEPASTAVKELAEAADKAEKARRGLYGKSAPRRDLWDLSLPQNRRKAKELGLETYRGADLQSGVVEYVFSASRFKLRFERENCLLVLSLNGVRAPEANPNQPGFERWAQAALEFARGRLTQRDLSFEIETIDRVGIVHGTVFLGQRDFALELLSRGLGYVVAGSRAGKRTEEYRAAEAAAREKKAGFWAEGLRPQAEEEVVGPTELLCRCSFFESPQRFYLRRSEEGDALDAKIAALSTLTPAVEPLKPGTMLLGRFEGAFFRCRLLRREEQALFVQFVDYGNSERLTLADLRQFPPSLAEPLPMAFAAALDFVIFPPKDNGFEAQTETAMAEVLESDELHVLVTRKEGGIARCVVGTERGLADSLNVRLLRAGLVALDPAAAKDPLLQSAGEEGAEANPELAAMITNADMLW